MTHTYDHWKSTNPDDKEYCHCGVHAIDCLMDEHGDCPVEDQEMEEEETMPTMSSLIDNARAHLQETRLRLRELPATFDMSKMRVALDTLGGDLDAMARLSTRQGE